MKCPACHHDNRNGAKFCEQCAAALKLTCARCGCELRPTARFCDDCGASTVGPSPPEQLSGTPQRSPQTYTPKHLADKILQSKSALEGERKQVTVVFADIKGSMQLAEQLDPEAWHQLLNRFFEILSDGVHRFEGTINQYTGDGIMALFGAPIAHEDHARRACLTALHLHEEIDRYAAEVRRRHGVSLSTRMGINSGEVIVGSIGDDLRMDYTAQGHTVGLAQRMESLAESNTCYLTAATAALVGDYFALDDLGEYPVKGVSEPVRVHRLVGSGASRSRLDVARARGLSCFVGRAADLRTLEDALAQARAGNGQVVGIVAEAGTGKSRLCYEFLEHCRALRLPVFEACAVAHGRNVPLLPVLEVFRAYLRITPEDTPGNALEKIAAGLAELDERYSDAVPLVSHFLGVADPGRAAPMLDAEVRQRQLFELMRALIRRTSATQPTVTLIEDLHWLDTASREFLEHMVEAHEDSHSLLLLNFRPEYHAEWMQRSWYRQIPLTPLGSEAVDELLADLLGDDPTVTDLAGLIYAHARGNPFFTEEVAQSLIESGHFEGVRGAYRLVRPIEQLEVPPTVQALLTARIDRLQERDKRLLQVAAVIGRDFPERLLCAVAELTADEMKTALATLRRAEFIHEKTLYPAAEYAFKHPLTHEVALGSQLRERRRHLHSAVARAIERQDAAHLDERAALLAHHWEEAGEAMDAARWHARAAAWVGLTDFAAATYHWERVRTLLRELPDDREAAMLGIAACTQLLSLTLRMGMGLGEARALLDEGLALADAIGDRRAHINLSQAYGFALNAAGQMPAYLELAIRIRSMALEMDDVAVHVNTSMCLVDALGHAGRLAETLEAAEAGLANCPRHTPPAEWTFGFNPYPVLSLWRSYCLVMMGRMSEGLAEIERCRRLAEEDGTLEMVAYALHFAAEAYYRAHDPAQALASARKCEAISSELGEPPNVAAVTQLAFGWAHLAAGRATDAIAPARAALHLHGHVENEMTGWSATLLAEALLAAGDLPAAEVAAREAVALCQRSQRAVFEAESQGVLARVLLRREGAAACNAALAAAAALIERTGARSLEPALLEWHAERAAVLGDTGSCEQLLAQAERGYEAVGAPGQAARLAAARPAK